MFKDGGLKTELMRIGLVMFTAGCGLALFVAYPTLPFVIFGVLLIAAVAYISEQQGDSDSIMWVKKAVVVTGCDTGFGHELAVKLSDMGVLTFAGCLYADGEGAQRLKDMNSEFLQVIQMDVTKQDQVDEALKTVKKQCEEYETRLWGVVNNAGLNFLGDVELTTMDQYEKCVQINQLGMIRVTKAFLPLIRKIRGRIVNVTSVKGTFAEPLNAAYASTKFACEAFSDALRREMIPFGVTVSIIEPCNFGGATDAINPERMRKSFDEMWINASEEVQKTYGYGYLSTHSNMVYKAAPTACMNVNLVVDAMIHSLFSLNPKIRYLINGGTGLVDIYWIRSKLVHYLPTSWFDRWLRNDMKKLHKPSAVAALEEMN